MNRVKAAAFSGAVAVGLFVFLRWAQSSEEARQNALTIVEVLQGVALLALVLILLDITHRRRRR